MWGSFSKSEPLGAVMQKITDTKNKKDLQTHDQNTMTEKHGSGGSSSVPWCP